MNIDEHLEKLAERHEALAQTVEIIVAMHKENERRSAERSAEIDRRFVETDRRLGQVLEAITRIARSQA